MRAERVLRFEVPSRRVLEHLATGPLPPGLAGSPGAADFFRELFFDTEGRDLERRGVTVRLAVRRDGRRVLTVDAREREGQGVHANAAAEVPDDEAAVLFAGDTEPARLLRALTDPARLEARLELETTRWRRRVHTTAEPRVELELVCDAVVVRSGELTAELQELEVAAGEEVSAVVEAAAERLAGEHGLRVALAGKLARARELLEDLELQGLEHAVRSARAVAVLAVSDGRVAMRESEGRLRVPAGAGWGEEACRRALRESFGHARARVRLLGTSVGSGARPALEVWLAEEISAVEADEAQELVWVPLEEALERVGGPQVRDVATLAALNLAVRLGVPAPAGASASAPARDPFRAAAPPVRPPRAAPAPHPRAQHEFPAPETLINMELSELAFQERVLALARDRRHPLLERVRFVSILGSNLDEFVMTRVAGFLQQVASGSRKRTLDGLTPEEQLEAIGVRMRQLYEQAYRFLWGELVPEMTGEGIHLLAWGELEARDRSYLREHYGAQLGAVLTPRAVDPGHPFPHIRNLRPALGLVVRLRDTGAEHFAAVELPGDLPRFVPLPGGRRFVPLEEVVAASLPDLYPGLEVAAAHPFRVTRSANFTIDEEASDLLQAVEEKVQQRPLGPVVRLEVERAMPGEMRDLLLRELRYEAYDRPVVLREDDVYPVDRLVDLYALRELAALPLPELHYEPLQRAVPLDPARPVWPVLRERELLVHFPYDSFEATVERVLGDAARDDKVAAIKITLYRTNRSSRVVRLLRRARRRGKEVVAMVELTASFDERRNIEWARSLESVGIHVVYGPPNLKVHAKTLLVVRREKDGLRRYVYIGTGNLNAATAAGYTDLALLTTDPELGEEVSEVFNYLTGYAAGPEFRRLLVAPFNMRARFVELIEREIEHARAGREAGLRLKLNGLTDRELIGALYRASQAGVRAELVVRGLCALRPGVPGLSENIRVVSILGRFLEHARIYRFHNAGDPEYYIGSADWRPRNLTRRVEVVAPVRDPEHRARLDRILDANLGSPDAWELGPDGRYTQRRAES